MFAGLTKRHAKLACRMSNVASESSGDLSISSPRLWQVRFAGGTVGALFASPDRRRVSHLSPRSLSCVAVSWLLD